MDNFIYYRKVNNDSLFKYLEESELKLHNLQNYLPIYNNFFNLNLNNFNNINLNQKYSIDEITEINNRNNVLGLLKNNLNNKNEKKPIFIKFSPLLDPLKYLTGKYDEDNDIKYNLPLLDNYDCCLQKISDKNNSAYVDGFFTYLSSILKNNFNFENGVDYYGSYLALKEKFYYNIVDDIDYLNESDYFHNNKEILFTIEK